VATRKMHQTTVRFGPDLWQALEQECERLGISAAQFLREAALARLMYTAGKRGDMQLDTALELADGFEESAAPNRQSLRDEEMTAVPAELAFELVRDWSRLENDESAALWAQGRQARRRAQELRGLAERRRSPRG
jgi:hypothetical protein